MDEKKAEDFIPKVHEILGEKYKVDKAINTGSLRVILNDITIFRIFFSMWANAFVVRLDVKKHRKTAKKIADELGMELIDPSH